MGPTSTGRHEVVTTYYGLTGSSFSDRDYFRNLMPAIHQPSYNPIGFPIQLFSRRAYFRRYNASYATSFLNPSSYRPIGFLLATIFASLIFIINIKPAIQHPSYRPIGFPIATIFTSLIFGNTMEILPIVRSVFRSQLFSRRLFLEI